MATPQALEALEKTKQALAGIKRKLEPVLHRLNNNDNGGFEDKTPQARVTVALSIGLMRYMGARLRGLDQGRKRGDPLREQLDNMRKVLAEIKQKHAEIVDMKKTKADNRNEEKPSMSSKSKLDVSKVSSRSTDSQKASYEPAGSRLESAENPSKKQRTS